jgi:hypothetical protein
MKNIDSTSARMPSREFLAMLKRIRNRVITYGVVSDKEEEFLRKHTDYFVTSRKPK